MLKHVEGKEAWLALVFSTLCYILMCIPDGSFGILYDPLVHMYDASRTSIGWALSLYWISIYLAGLLFSPMIDLFGCRVLAFMSGILYGAGIAMSSVVQSLPALYICYGVLAGLGCGGLYMACATVIQQLFTYNRGFANGMSSLGFSLGGIIHPLHTLYFVQEFGVRGTLLIQGALIFNSLVFSFALKSPNIAQDELADGSKTKHLRTEADGTLSEIDIQMTENRALCNKTEGNSCGAVSCEDVSLEYDAESRCLEAGPNTSAARESRDIKSKASNSSCHESVRSAPSTHFVVGCFYRCLRVLGDYFKRMLDFSLLKNAAFIVATLHFSLLWMARLSIMAQIVGCAIQRGVHRDNAAYLISISGFGNLVMRIVASVLMNFSWMNPVMFSGLASIIIGVSGLVAAYSNTYAMFSITAVLMGVSEAIAMANLPLLIVHIIGLSRFPRGVALVWTLMLPAPLGAAPFSGWLVDRSGTYYLAFLVIAGEGVISTILAAVVFVLIKRKKSGST